MACTTTQGCKLCWCGFPQADRVQGLRESTHACYSPPPSHAVLSQVKRHLGQCNAAQQAQHAEQLLGQLLAWGLDRGQLHAIIRLPLGPVEEQVGQRVCVG